MYENPAFHVKCDGTFDGNAGEVLESSPTCTPVTRKAWVPVIRSHRPIRVQPHVHACHWCRHGEPEKRGGARPCGSGSDQSESGRPSTTRLAAPSTVVGDNSIDDAPYPNSL
nr:hypothetical protein Iba_chr07eCG1280 [Ipomoea batatas]